MLEGSTEYWLGPFGIAIEKMIVEEYTFYTLSFSIQRKTKP